jgi:hypothetical protein
MKKFWENVGAVVIIAAVLTVLYFAYHPLLVTFFGTKF